MRQLAKLATNCSQLLNPLALRSRVACCLMVENLVKSAPIGNAGQLVPKSLVRQMLIFASEIGSLGQP